MVGLSWRDDDTWGELHEIGDRLSRLDSQQGGDVLAAEGNLDAVRLRLPALFSVNVSVLYPELEFAASRTGDTTVNEPQYSGAPHPEGELLVVVPAGRVLLTDVVLERDVTVSTDVAVVVAVVDIVTVPVVVVVVAEVLIVVVIAVTVELTWVEVTVLTVVTLPGPDGKTWATASPQSPARTTASSIPANIRLLYVMRNVLLVPALL